VTLTKTERHYSPTTMYADRAITPTLFQWESQSTTRTNSPTGQRYVHHAQRGSTVHLFLRQTKEPDGDLGAPPYLYAGTMTYLQHTGDRPMRIQWRLSNALPADIYQLARVAAVMARPRQPREARSRTAQTRETQLVSPGSRR
jgi:hypothetical protein